MPHRLSGQRKGAARKEAVCVSFSSFAHLQPKLLVRCRVQMTEERGRPPPLTTAAPPTLSRGSRAVRPAGPARRGEAREAPPHAVLAEHRGDARQGGRKLAALGRGEWGSCCCGRRRREAPRRKPAPALLGWLSSHLRRSCSLRLQSRGSLGGGCCSLPEQLGGPEARRPEALLERVRGGRGALDEAGHGGRLLHLWQMWHRATMRNHFAMIASRYRLQSTGPRNRPHRGLLPPSPAAARTSPASR